MRLTQIQQKRILEISVSSLYRHERKAVRRVFDACESDHYNVQGYRHLLERATKVLTRAVAAIDAMEKDESI
jgi:hypothetical protein